MTYQITNRKNRVIKAVNALLFKQNELQPLADSSIILGHIVKYRATITKGTNLLFAIRELMYNNPHVGIVIINETYYIHERLANKNCVDKEKKVKIDFHNEYTKHYITEQSITNYRSK